MRPRARGDPDGAPGPAIRGVTQRMEGLPLSLYNSDFQINKFKKTLRMEFKFFYFLVASSGVIFNPFLLRSRNPCVTVDSRT